MKVHRLVIVGLLTALLALVVSGCTHLPPGSHPKAQCEPSSYPDYQPTPQEVERDHIYQLTAYGVVHKGWQTGTWGSEPTPRGYNIGSILVDASKPLGEQIVCWARNSVITTRNGTQHGEVRLITNYLSNAKATSLKETYKLYTTLEPCAMCGGMMTLQSLPVTIYGQTDPDFGDGIQRLEVNTHAAGGFCPYPRGVYSQASALPIREEIDNAYKTWQEQGNRGLTSWLITPEAEKLYAKAVDQLKTWPVAYTENIIVKDMALNYLINVVPAEYQETPYSVGCNGD